MDAPLYPPSSAYVQPLVMPMVLNTGTVSIADLMAIPEARAILLAEVPSLKDRVSTGALQMHLGNFTLRFLVEYKMFKTDDLDRVDARFAKLPPMKVMR